MEKIKITAEIIENFWLEDIIQSIPEFFELKDSVENSRDRWHQQEPVFDHTLSVISALKNIFENHKKLETEFNERIDRNTRKTLLKIAALLHDIGKKETMVKKDGFTECPGHEEVGVKKSRGILKRFDLSEKEIKIILDIIANHSHFHKLLVPNNPNFEEDLEKLKARFGESIYSELILLSYADTVNSKLKEINPDEFKYRISFYEKALEGI